MEQVGVAPARPADEPHVIRTYRRRGGRLNVGQQRAWDANADRYFLPADVQTRAGFVLSDAFGRTAPLAVEIGFGVGEALAPLATSRPDWNVVGFEVWQPGIAQCIASIGERPVANLRMSSLDATWCLEHIVAPKTVSELWTFFPDPWPKPRHHKRRLVSPAFAALATSRLAPGGSWRLATDWQHYAEQMQEVLDAVPQLSGGVTERYAERPLTRFERRAIADGRPVTDLTYSRCVEPNDKGVKTAK